MKRRRDDKIVFAGSERDAPQGFAASGPLDPAAPLVLTLHFRRRSPALPTGGAADLARFKRLRSRRSLDNERRRTHAAAARRIERYLKTCGVAVRDVDFTRRQITLEAPTKLLTDLFHADVQTYGEGAQAFPARSGALRIAKKIAPWTRAIVGFDKRPFPLRPAFAHADPALALWPTEVAALYGVPLDRDVSKACVAIVALGGAYLADDLTRALERMGRAAPEIVEVRLQTPADAFGAFPVRDQELALDLQILASLLPRGKIVLYIAEPTQDGLLAALSDAIHDTVNQPTVISVSWGVAEAHWTERNREALNAALCDAARSGVTVLAACGDELATCGEMDGAAHVWFPASSPMVVACGGTSVALDGRRIASERVWHDGRNGTGGGVSDCFDVAAFQASASVPPSVNGGRRGRGTPDVTAFADPSPGYRIVVGGADTAMGGTSASTPLWAGIVAIAKLAARTPFGLATPKLYAHPELFRPITVGDNKVGGVGYQARAGWSACAGLGAPSGPSFVDGLARV